MSIDAPGAGPIIVFDGVGVLCNGWVRFLLRHDRDARHSYRWFGRNETCFLPTPEQRVRFIE